MAWSTWLKRLVLPPAGPVLVGMVGWCLTAFGAQWEGVGVGMMAGALLSLGFLSMPLVGLGLLRWLERGQSSPDLDGFVTPDPSNENVALVILDGGKRRAADGTESVRPDTLERLVHGAAVARATGLPVLVSGDGAGPLMADVLRDGLGVATRWVEPHSRDTQENAFASAEILRAEGIDTVVLVTHGWHMRRAAGCFRRTGLRVVPSPAALTAPGRWQRGARAWLPDAAALLASYQALHEMAGLIWYRLRFGVAAE